ncbi:MAG TPA: NUDIX domain-containing protein, partial [bacterium]|nr:NUDIX domain-containing protein [bacterium]
MTIIFASGPVIIEDNRVLLVKDTKDDFWKFCGGRVEDFESDIKLTAAREAREELGLEIEILNEQ